MLYFNTNISNEGNRIKSGLKDLNNIMHDFVINWGHAEHHKGIIFNTEQAIKNAYDKEYIYRILNRNQVSSPKVIKPNNKTTFPIVGRKFTHDKGNDLVIVDSYDECLRSESDYFVSMHRFIEEYVVHVMDQAVFWVEEKYIDEDKPNDLIIRTKTKDVSVDKISKKIVNLAKRSVYALGLDFGVVLVGKDHKGNYYTIDVDCVCKDVSDACIDAYTYEFRKMILKYNDFKNDLKDTTIGADVECLVKDKNTNELVIASQFIKNQEKIGYDLQSIEAGKKYYPILEIRPDYSRNPIEVFMSIEYLLDVVRKELHYKNIGIYAGSVPLDNYSLGGHIHFGVEPNTKLIRALDNYLALPILMVENTFSARQRNSSYGVLGNYKVKKHGFEYRSISSWLVSPKIALAVLCLAKVIVNEYLILEETFLNDFSDIRSFYLVKKYYFKENLKKIMQNIKKTDTYKRYKHEIKPLFTIIEKEEVWEEDVDIKESWEYGHSKDEFHISSIGYVPKEIREELSIDIGEKIDVQIGSGENIQLTVYPKDELSKKGLMRLSSDAQKRIGLNQDDELGLFKKESSKTLIGGPVVGVFCDVQENHLGLFGNQTFLFKRLIKQSKQKGYITYIFSIYDVFWKEKYVYGYGYDFKLDEWYRDYFPLPNVIYERGLNICEFNFGQKATRFLEHVKEYGIEFINHPIGIDTISDKWRSFNVLKEHRLTFPYLPETYEYNERTLDYMLDRYDTVYVKLKGGYGGAGIYCIEKQSDRRYLIIHKDDKDDENEIYDVYRDEIKRIIIMIMEKENTYYHHYIIQQGIKFIEYNHHGFELRLLMVKNSLGDWVRSALVSRIRETNKEFINYWDGFELSSIVLREALGKKEKMVRDKINQLATDVTTVLDQNNLKLGEVAIDIGIDTDLNPYIIEMNSKPDNLLSYIGAFKRRRMVINRILGYAKYLSTKK